MTRYWFYLTFDVDSFLAIQRKYEVNHSYVCIVKIQSILNMTKSVENININIR